MITMILILALPIAIQVSGVILGAPRATRAERYLFWMSSTGLALFLLGCGIGMVGGHLEGKIYCEPFAMGPITTVGNVAIACGVLLAFVGAFFQLGIGAVKLLTLARGRRGNEDAANNQIHPIAGKPGSG
jgi:hypothetical protein